MSPLKEEKENNKKIRQEKTGEYCRKSNNYLHAKIMRNLGRSYRRRRR